ncbi:YiaA/YiaB family inner membrane protein [Paraflavitalea devenefica]|uniref:YiaA/YiaB family inner membrane protein n=1 Tax=Paraflavitalea devenefica TaxID=2716334 RepID=UPI001FE62CCB|nr:YiaA/YiaB family inner membrane protein [Paraflavitalea devenefica]
MFGLFSAISVQKAVRDQLEGIPVTNLYYGIAWFTTLLSILLLTIGLWNADLTKSEKGFYAMAFTLSIFAAIAVQKNTRDVKASQQDGNNSPGNNTEK